MAITTAAHPTEFLHLPRHGELVLDLQADDELLCLAGHVRLTTPALYQDPGSAPAPSLATGRGWRAPAACRVSVAATGPAPARLQHRRAPTTPTFPAEQHGGAPSTLALPQHAHRPRLAWFNAVLRWLSMGMARG